MGQALISFPPEGSPPQQPASRWPIAGHPPLCRFLLFLFELVAFELIGLVMLLSPLRVFGNLRRRIQEHCEAWMDTGLDRAPEQLRSLQDALCSISLKCHHGVRQTKQHQWPLDHTCMPQSGRAHQSMGESRFLWVLA